MKIGVRAHDLGKLNPESLKIEFTNYGFDGLQLVSSKVFGKTIDELDIEMIKTLYRDQIFMLGSYFNMIHPNIEIVNEGIQNFKKHIDYAKKLDVKYVGTETGSLMGSPWGYVKENHSDESFIKVKNIVSDLVDYASIHEVDVAIEGAWAHTIYSPKRLKQLVDEVNHKNLKVIIDVYNFLNINNHENHVEILKESINLLKNKIVIFHLKDYVVIGDLLKQVGLGKGLMNYKEMLKLIKENLPNSYLIFEGVVKEEMKDSLTFIKKILKEIN